MILQVQTRLFQAADFKIHSNTSSPVYISFFEGDTLFLPSYLLTETLWKGANTGFYILELSAVMADVLVIVWPINLHDFPFYVHLKLFSKRLFLVSLVLLY